MLSERHLEELLAQFEGRMQGVIQAYLEAMGEHLRAIGRLTASDVHRLTEMKRVGVNARRIQREVARAANLSIAELDGVFRSVAESDARFAGQWFASGYPPVVKGAPKLSAPIERILKAQLRVTGQAFQNLSQTTILTESYRAAVDVAVQTVQSGLADYESAVRGVMKKAAADGLRVQYPNSGLTRRLDTAVRQNVLDGVRSLNQDVLNQLGKEYGADGVELSAHALCAEDHLPYQGRQFSNREFARIQNNLDRPFGMWNCKHTSYPILLGISPPAYTEKELESFRRNSSEKISIDGRTMSRYQWTQEQRRIETAVRQQKDIAVMAKASGDMTARREAQAVIGRLTGRYDAISQAAGLIEQKDRMAVSGFRPVKTVAELSDAKKFENASFASERIYQRHINKHLAEYGEISEEEYVHRARKLLQSKASDDILTLTRSDGSISKYRISTNEFAVGTKDGDIRTAFKPKEGIVYWRKELGRN